MNLKKTLRVLNQMESERVIGKYAIGGAVAAFLYVEPGATFDIDVFILWEAGAGSLLDLKPIYDYLRRKGYNAQREGILVEGWEVQFLTVSTDLEREALAQATRIEIAGVPTHVFTQEHLMAICLETGRPKDLARLIQFIHEGRPDEERLAQILNRHGLGRKWNDFRKRFLEPL